PTNVFDPWTTWWRHELLHRSTMVAHGTLLPRYHHARTRTEAGWLADPPSSEAAFHEADHLERQWFADVSYAHLRDGRPAWVRRSWRAVDRAARIDEELHRGREP